MNLGMLGGVISGITGLLFLVVALATFRARRTSREVQERKTTEYLYSIALKHMWRLIRLGDARGWSDDNAWPVLPHELTPEYLTGRADADDNASLSELAKIVGQISGKGGGKDD